MADHRLYFCEKCKKAVQVNIYQRAQTLNAITCVECGGYIYKRSKKKWNGRCPSEVCWNCHKPKAISILNRMFKHYGVRCCSIQCVGQYYKKLAKPSPSPVIVKCLECGEEFIKKYRMKFCSRKCCIKFEYKMRRNNDGVRS
jgi:formylmethanofuran dehydrogenase subunit E